MMKARKRQCIYKQTILFVLSIYILCSCMHSEIEDELRFLTQQKVMIDADSLIYVGDNSEIHYRDSTQYKLIFFHDSTTCSKCAITNLYLWIDQLDSLSNAFIPTIPILLFSPSKEDTRSALYFAKHSNMNKYIYVDTCQYFIRNNPHLTHNKLSHTFLLDNKDSVVLVGNPLSNSKIRKLLENIINQGHHEVNK